MMTDVHASAPGRVNLIGEHTDYNGGFVLPMPISQQTRVRLVMRSDNDVHVVSRQYAGDKFHYGLGSEHRTATWLDYVMGCTAALREAGHRIGGCDLTIESAVPVGSGLSSSAALEVAVLRAFREAYDLELDDLSLALLGQKAENELVGAPVGAMDQIAASLGTPGQALLIDMATFVSRPVAIPSSIEVVILGSGVLHDLAAGTGYRRRRAECEQAAALLAVESLRDAVEVSPWQIAELPPPLDRRVRHVITENARVLATVCAIERDDRAALRSLFAASHISMRDDYEVSTPEIDALVALAEREPHVIGARLTGGGFGGSIVLLASAGRGKESATRIASRYRAATNLDTQILVAGGLP